MADESFRRLRTVLKPKTYDLTISPNLIKNTFTGLVYIFCDKNNLENENNLVELKGLAAATNGAPRRGPGVRKVLFHRATKLKF